MQPIIGLTIAIENGGTLGTRSSYPRAIERAGGLPLLFPSYADMRSLDEVIELCDGFFFTGGVDLEPAVYGEEKKPTCGETQPQRDAMELALLSLAIKANKPILAVCRGAQLVNAMLGGTLYQDLPTEWGEAVNHRQPIAKREEPSHDILITRGTPLFELTGKDRMVGNSFHHQAVKVLGRGLLPMATAEDGLIEGFYHPGMRYLRAYQWHPELIYDYDANSALFMDFIAACAKGV